MPSKKKKKKQSFSFSSQFGARSKRPENQQPQRKYCLSERLKSNKTNNPVSIDFTLNPGT
jgi:hypothetical protein